MIRQIASVAFLLAAIMLMVGHASVSNTTTAQRLIILYGPQQAMSIAKDVTDSPFLEVIWAQIKSVWIYILGGGILGFIARRAIYVWVKPLTVDVTEKVAVIDEAGGKYAMYGVAFAHAPSATKLPIADVSDIELTHQASQIENELLGAYRAGGHPADTTGYHGVSLFQHCFSVWEKAVTQYGACTLESMLALAHDAGKLITFQRASDGTWVRLSPKHEMFNSEAIRRLPCFFTLEAAERDLLLLALGYMQGSVAPDDVPVEVISAVQKVHILDIRSTGEEVVERRAGQVDSSQIIKALIDLANEPPTEWNVNKSHSASTPLGAIHMGEGVLLVAGRALRSALAQRVDSATAGTLGLQIPSSEWHESFSEIASAMQKAGVGQRIVNNVASESGWFSARIGQSRIPFAIAIKTEVSPAARSKWGMNQLEIVLTEAKKS